MESASNATTPWWCCGHGAQCRLPVKKLGLEIQWIDLLSCCLPRGLLVLLVFRKLAQGVSLYSIAHIVRLNMSELSFRWDSPGAWCGIRFPLPVSFVLPDDLKSDSKSICTVHHHLRLWHAHFLVAEHRHHWHYDGRVSGEH